jgi:hypothetical protein
VVPVCEHGADSHDGTQPADAAQPAQLGALVSRAVELGIRVQMIRRPGRRLAGDVGTVMTGWVAGREPWLRRGEVSATTPDLTERDLKELAAGTPIIAFT